MHNNHDDDHDNIVFGYVLFELRNIMYGYTSLFPSTTSPVYILDMAVRGGN